MPVLSLLIALPLETPLPAIAATLPMGLIASMRKAFLPLRALLSPIIFMVFIFFMECLIGLTRPMPLVLLSCVMLIYFVAYYLILSSGNGLGLLILVVAVLSSTMGMYSLDALDFLNESFYLSCFCTLLLLPLLYWVFPARTRDIMVEDFTPAIGGEYFKRALIRRVVLMILSLWLYTVLDVSNLIYAIVAVFVTVFPTRKMLYRELRERIISTLFGSACALLLLGIFYMVSHLPILLLLLALAGLFFGDRMMHGSQPPMVYQFAFSVMLALTVGALSVQAPWDATLLRIGLTILGAISAVVLTSVLELWLLNINTLQHVNPKVVHVTSH